MQLPLCVAVCRNHESCSGLPRALYGKSDGERSAKAKFLIATVKGDVHDIGKNLVDIILTNNGYEVINLGIKAMLAPSLKRS